MATWKPIRAWRASEYALYRGTLAVGYGSAGNANCCDRRFNCRERVGRALSGCWQNELTSNQDWYTMAVTSATQERRFDEFAVREDE
jgi:hypothetical protein